MTRHLRSLPDCSFPLPSRVTSPVNPVVLKFFLHGYSPELSEFLYLGFSEGFRLGFLGEVSRGEARNYLSASRNVEGASVAISKELERGHTSGPFVETPFPRFQCSALGAVPKKDGSTLNILDLSSSKGLSD